jgi:hypothetical protein
MVKNRTFFKGRVRKIVVAKLFKDYLANFFLAVYEKRGCH